MTNNIVRNSLAHSFFKALGEKGFSSGCEQIVKENDEERSKTNCINHWWNGDN